MSKHCFWNGYKFVTFISEPLFLAILTKKRLIFCFDITKKFGKDALLGYGFIDKLIFVHCTKYRMARGYEMEMFGGEIFRTLDTDCYPAYLSDLKKYKKDEFIRIGNNQVYFVDGDTRKIITYDWRHIPVRILD